MKVKVGFEYEETDSKWETRCVQYVVNGKWEFIDKAMRLRHGKKLRYVYAYTKTGRHYWIMAAYLDHFTHFPSNMEPITDGDLADNDRFDELLERTWRRIEKMPWLDRKDNPVPAGFRK